MLKSKQNKKKFANPRLTFFIFGVLSLFLLIFIRLFWLQVIDGDYYRTLASGQHQILSVLIPRRGEIFMQDKDGNLQALAQNRQLYMLYVVPKEFSKTPLEVVTFLKDYFKWDDVTTQNYLNHLSKVDDPFEQIKKGLTEDEKKQLEALNISGLHFLPEDSRFYPNNEIGSSLIGFYSYKSDNPQGQYGLEGYFNKELAGTRGEINSERDAAGRLITVAAQSLKSAIDGSNYILTIDPSIEYIACKTLNEYVARLGAKGGEVIILNPKTGAVLAMCSYPEFDPNKYFEVENIEIYNNPAVSNQYEPGSIFKSITMAAALDMEKVNPKSSYLDEGCRMVTGWYKPICNSDVAIKPHGNGVVSMTKVLVDSLNTGVMYLIDQLGEDVFKKYVEAFGFGKTTDITLPGEAIGDISTLGKQPVYAYTAAFGQGITVTSLQMVTAYAAIANGGELLRPYIVSKIIHSDGTTETYDRRVIRQVISPRVSTLLSGMLVSAIEDGHGWRAGVPGYYIAGKTGTAQVASSQGGYSDETIHSFVGFGPIEDPKFVMIAKLDNPGTRFAESSATPLFGEIAKFIMQYYQIPTNR
jgi:cell division protein FtsI/penicillin-binding protein 2